jgi:hypothetical protein
MTFSPLWRATSSITLQVDAVTPRDKTEPKSVEKVTIFELSRPARRP